MSLLSHLRLTVRKVVTFVVILSYRGVYKGLVGPFDDEAAAEAWAFDNADAQTGWAWEIDPVVTPERLAAYEPPPRPLLRVVS